MTARAQSGSPELDTAHAELESARFDDALRTLDLAESTGHLELGTLAGLLELRAIAQLALGDTDAVTSTLRALASIDPTHAWSPLAPPELDARFTVIVGETPRLGLTLDVDEADVQLTLSLGVVDPGRLVRGLELFVDRGGGFELSQAPLALPRGVEVRAYARALGPGGALLAGVGTEQAPRLFGGSAEPQSSGIDPWPIVVGSIGGAVVAAVVAIVVFFATEPPITQPSGPVLR